MPSARDHGADLLPLEGEVRWDRNLAKLRHRRARNVRDYGMFERREAAQYFPDAKCPMGAKP